MADENENNESDTKNKFCPSFDKEGIPVCLEWTPEDVAEWIEHLGFPQYKVGFGCACFSPVVKGSTVQAINNNRSYMWFVFF